MDKSIDLTLGLKIQRRWTKVTDKRRQVRDLDSMAQRIVALRHSRGWTQRQAYETCDIQKTAWNNYERAGSRPGIDQAAAICEIFGVTLDWLYTGNTAGLPSEALERLYGRHA